MQSDVNYIKPLYILISLIESVTKANKHFRKRLSDALQASDNQDPLQKCIQPSPTPLTSQLSAIFNEPDVNRPSKESTVSQTVENTKKFSIQSKEVDQNAELTDNSTQFPVYENKKSTKFDCYNFKKVVPLCSDKKLLPLLIICSVLTVYSLTQLVSIFILLYQSIKNPLLAHHIIYCLFLISLIVEFYFLFTRNNNRHTLGAIMLATLVMTYLNVIYNLVVSFKQVYNVQYVIPSVKSRRAECMNTLQSQSLSVTPTTTAHNINVANNINNSTIIATADTITTKNSTKNDVSNLNTTTTTINANKYTLCPILWISKCDAVCENNESAVVYILLILNILNFIIPLLSLLFLMYCLNSEENDSTNGEHCEA
ncbi:unnamed protein product [Trichobilharzia szidati]|nr:unnamed protein product [Trichobilharzia szidati]